MKFKEVMRDGSWEMVVNVLDVMVVRHDPNR
jgi:hypothetical protein